MFLSGSVAIQLRRLVAALILFSAIASCYGQGGVSLGDASIGLAPGTLVNWSQWWASAPPPSSNAPDGIPQGSNSPIGTWEVAIRGTGSSAGATGIAFMTFNSDQSLTGYGLTPYTMFTLSGAWTLDSSGETVGNYTEDLNGGTISGSFIGKARAGKLLRGTVVAGDGTFSILGNAAGTLPDLSGSWVGLVTEARTTVVETYNLTPMGGYPGVFEISGSGSGPDGQFSISGDVIATSKGNIAAFGESDFQAGGTDLSYVSGKYNFTKQTATLNGGDSNGFRIRSKLSR